MQLKRFDDREGSILGRSEVDGGDDPFEVKAKRAMFGINRLRQNVQEVTRDVG